MAAINGAALGGGFEIALACNHRIVVDDPKVEVGLPEASLGLLPGGGGVTRIVRLLGIQSGLMDVLLQGTRFKPGQARRRRAWSTSSSPPATSWSRPPRPGSRPTRTPSRTRGTRPATRCPAATPKTPALAGFLPAFPALLRKQTKGADYPAQRAILSAAVEGAQVDFDTASRIESRYLTNLIVNQGSKNMIQAFFFDLQAINAGKLRPQGIEPWKATKVGVLGAGMMGAGIAYVVRPRRHGGRAQGRRRRERREGQGLLREAARQGDLARPLAPRRRRPSCSAGSPPTADPADLAGCDLVIEAVFEDPSLKHQVFAEIADAREPRRAALLQHLDAADHRARRRAWTGPTDFIGLHFFSPVDKMPLVEIIRARRPPTRRWPRPTTSSSRSGRRRSWSTTAAASTPRG